jgi:predicted transglutaminase-like cysteine proteinase
MPGRLATALVALACLVAQAQATPRLREARDAPPLRAWTELCERDPDECAIDLNEPETLVLTDAARELVEAVNRHVNHSVRPMLDTDRWGEIDRWTLPVDGHGDCEDYQLLKRKLLIEAGLPRRALRMTVVIDELGEGHAVLTIRTDRADLILDNKTDAILSPQATGYEFIKRESGRTIGWAYLQQDADRSLIAMAR